jgi:hypothetical protein
MKKLVSFTLALTLVLVSVLALATVALAASMSGAIWTTDAGGNPVDKNIYDYREDVYLNGGPKGGQTQGLPDGQYWVKVTAPDGTPLGNPDVPVTVSNGRFEGLQLWALVTKESDGTQGYDVTPNNGGEYKVWLSQDLAFPNGASKTDNFKVRYTEELPPPEPSIEVEKLVEADYCPGWHDADTGPGPRNSRGSSTLISFWFIVENTGDVELTDIELTDSDPVINPILQDELVNMGAPTSLLPGEWFEVFVRDIPAELEHHNTATVIGWYDGDSYRDDDDVYYYSNPTW